MDSSSSVSSSVSSVTINSSQTSSFFLQRPPLDLIPITAPSNTILINNPRHTLKTTPIKLKPQTSFTFPLSETVLPLTPFDMIPTHSPPPHIPDPSDFDPIILCNIKQPIPRKSLLVPTSIKGRRRSQFDPSLPLPKPCKHHP